ncbi:MAG: right-handed parallel beta-helix repeat-containing protein, partial [Steroidobacteraceae bacterium]
MISIAVFVGVAALIVAGWSLEARHSGPESLSNTLSLHVTNGTDRGSGTLREALFVAATAPAAVRISLDVPRISLTTALPPIVNPHGLSIVAGQGGSIIDAHALREGPVLDVAAANVSLQGLAISHCANAAILVRAVHFSLQSTTLDTFDIGVDVAQNAHGLLLERNRFIDDRIGIRFTAASPDTTVAGNQFTGEREAGVWAVRGDTDLQAGSISVRGNQFDRDHTAIIAGNISILIDRNAITGAPAAAVDLIGAGAVVRHNRVSNGAGMGIIADGAQAAVIESNELNALAAYGIMIRGSSNVLVRANRVYDCAYGMAFVLGDARNPSTAVDNVIIEPRYDGIDIVGDSPILRHNHVLQPRAFALRVEDFARPGGSSVKSAPFLDHNSFAG